MAPLLGSYLRFLHNIQRHRWLDIPQKNWILGLLALLAPWPVLGVLPGGLPLTLVLLFLMLFLYLSLWWARRRFYVHFVPDSSSPEPGQDPLWPEDKLLLHATGHFSVEGKEASFTELLAYYRTFETREHAIMARNTPSRYLGGECEPETLGMWYIFVEPGHLKAVTAGRLYFGPVSRPALRLDYVRINEKGRELPMFAYLSFESSADRDRVQADLLLDQGGPAARPWRAPSKQ